MGGAFPSSSELACTSLDNCIVVANIRTGILTGVAFSWIDTGGTWSAAEQLPAKFTPNAVGCPSAMTCIAAGMTQPTAHPASALEQNGIWSPVDRLSLPQLSPLAPSGFLSAIDCTSSGTCVAVGQANYGGKTKGSIADAVTWSSNAWSSIAYLRTPSWLSDPQSYNYSSVSAVACSGGTQCTAVGGLFCDSLEGCDFSYVPFSSVLTPVRVPTAPSPPTVVTATGTLARVIARWAPPTDDGGDPVHTYTAVAEPGGRTCATAANSCVLRGLSNGHRYRVGVSDTTGYGKSASVESSRLAIAGATPAPPGDLQLRLRASNLMVWWRPSQTPQGEPVRAYVVMVHGQHGYVGHLGTHADHCEFLGASRDGNYTVFVVAENASGASSSIIGRVTSH
jgi:hypothetical protein